MLRSLKPLDTAAALLILFSVVLAEGIFLGRAELDWLRASWQLGWGPATFTYFPMLVLIASVVATCILLTLAHALVARQIIPLLVLLVSFTIALLAPPPLMHEESLFLSHRSDYEHLVELARTRQLSHTDKCRGDRLAPPTGYEHLAPQCISLGADGGFTLDFEIRTFYRPLVYFESTSSITYHPACGVCIILRQFDEHWYICQEDFN